MTNIRDHEDGGFKQTQKRDSDLQISQELNYDTSNMSVGPAIDFLYAMKPKIIDSERRENADEAISILENFYPEEADNMSEQAYNRGRVKPSKAVQLLENEIDQLDEITALSNDEMEDEHKQIREALDIVEEVYDERFQDMTIPTIASTAEGPYRRRKKQ